MKKVIPLVFISFALTAPMLSQASAPAAREACKQLIVASGYVAQDWGESWNWKTIDNKDGTWTVGARFIGMPPGGVSRNLYVGCTTKQKGDRWTIESITRLQ